MVYLGFRRRKDIPEPECFISCSRYDRLQSRTQVNNEARSQLTISKRIMESDLPAHQARQQDKDLGMNGP